MLLLLVQVRGHTGCATITSGCTTLTIGIAARSRTRCAMLPLLVWLQGHTSLYYYWYCCTAIPVVLLLLLVLLHGHPGCAILLLTVGVLLLLVWLHGRPYQIYYYSWYCHTVIPGCTNITGIAARSHRLYYCCYWYCCTATPGVLLLVVLRGHTGCTAITVLAARSHETSDKDVTLHYSTVLVSVSGVEEGCSLHYQCRLKQKCFLSGTFQSSQQWPRLVPPQPQSKPCCRLCLDFKSKTTIWPPGHRDKY